MSKFLWHSTPVASSTAEALSQLPFEHTTPPVAVPLPAALSQDIARSFRLLGVASFRVVVVNVNSMNSEAGWTVSEEGEVTDKSLDQPLDSSFPAATAAINLLAHASSDETLLHRLSPRRWGIAWRLDDPNVVLAEARFHERRDLISEADKTLLRLVCGVVTRPSDPPALPSAAEMAAEMAAAMTPATSHAPARRVPRLSLALLACSALLALGLAGAAVPELLDLSAEREAQRARLQAQADKTLVRGIHSALASGDYGDVQTVLSSYSSLGYFDGAAVLNLRQRAVALSGRTDPLRIGDPVSDDARRNAQAIELTVGAERLGQLLILQAPPPPQASPLQAWLPPLAWATALTALAALLALGASGLKPRPTRTA